MGNLVNAKATERAVNGNSETRVIMASNVIIPMAAAILSREWKQWQCCNRSAWQCGNRNSSGNVVTAFAMTKAMKHEKEGNIIGNGNTSVLSQW